MYEDELTPEDIKKAVNTIHRINHMDIDGVNPYDLLTAIVALDRQYPMVVWVKHKEGEESALLTCPTCNIRVITNYEAHREHYKEWCCKQCGQRLIWRDDEKGE